MGLRSSALEDMDLSRALGSLDKCPVLVTGHTGFKGGWLSALLTRAGALVSGYALPPTTSPSLYEATRPFQLAHECLSDIRDRAQLRTFLAIAQPRMIFHLAAQPLVRDSYTQPIETFDTNVMGTLSLLDAARQTPSVEAIVVVTSDKCYEPSDRHTGHIESDPLGGHDPYSASKACQDIATQSWRRSYPSGPLIATARAGNVIGGGDWAHDRLIPDMYRALESGEPLQVRNPSAVRPWQHVLDALSGYISLGAHLLAGERAFADAWNFGPAESELETVSWICDELSAQWGTTWHSPTTAGNEPHENPSLRLNSSKAMQMMNWQPRWSTQEALKQTGRWYAQFRAGTPATTLIQEQIEQYLDATEPSPFPA